MEEINISKAIINEYAEALTNHLENDVIIIGAGPAGMTAAYYLAQNNIKTAIFEKRLSIGGGIWGGASGRSVITVQEGDILEEMGIRYHRRGNLYVADAIEFATALGYKASHAGARIFNLLEFEDVIFIENQVSGVVLKDSTINASNLPVDPFCARAKYIVDGTGHPSEVIRVLTEKVADFPVKSIGEGPMNVEQSEEEVVKNTGEIYPGVFVSGMAVCAAYNFPRMGPIFGGMLKSGRKIADEIIKRMS